MPVLFAIVFLAAIAGLIKPYIPGWKRRYFGGAAIVSFILVGFTAPTAVGPKSAVASPAAAATAATTDAPAASEANDSAAAQPAPAPAVETKWAYQTDTDQMRGQQTRFATVESDNTVDLSFPYGEVHGTITVRKRATDGLNVMFSVDKGQILCHSFTSSHISVKFDDGPVKRFECTSSSDGSSETAFIEGSAGFLAQLRKSKRAMIEAEFFQKGNQQFSFETAGLDWK